MYTRWTGPQSPLRAQKIIADKLVFSAPEPRRQDQMDAITPTTTDDQSEQNSLALGAMFCRSILRLSFSRR